MSYRSLVLSFGSILLAACASGNPADAPAEVLNSPAFFEVGDRVFGAPVAEIAIVTKQSDCYCVAYFPMDDDVGSGDAKRLATEASARSEPVQAGQIELYPGHTYERLGVNSKCGTSSISWSCRANRLGVTHDLPEQLTISDTRFLKQFKAQHTVGTKTLYDYLIAMEPFGQTPKPKCDQSGRFCLAAVALSSRVIAIWNVGPDRRTKETAAHEAERQGRAILLVANVR